MPRRGKKSDKAQLQDVRDWFEHIILMIYHYEVAHDEGLFAHLGVASNVTFEQFRRPYRTADLNADTDRFFRDVHRFPPVSERLKAEGAEAGLTPEKTYALFVERRAAALADGNAEAVKQYDEMLARFKTELLKWKN
jgi:hypothetical protein